MAGRLLAGSGLTVVGEADSVAAALVAAARLEPSAVLALATLDGSQLHPAAPRAPARGWLRDGLRYARQRPEILAPLLMMTLIGTFTYEFEVTLPVVARNTFHGGPTAYSWLLGAFGVDAVRRATRVTWCAIPVWTSRRSASSPTCT